MANIFVEANSVLAGADKMQEMVTNAISLGPNNVASKSYQIKSRIKSPTSLVAKVQDRQRKGKPDYNCSNVKDLVGFRFLTLFPNDLVSLVELFCNFLLKFDGPPVLLLSGNEFSESVEEVIVYKSTNNTETYDRIYEFLNRFFSPKRGFPEGFVKLETKDTKYSSVHLVVSGQVYSDGETKIFPIEFQLRTVFEDIWGEIEHKLVYKNDAGDIEETAKTIGQRLIKSLKTSLDGCAEYADDAYWAFNPRPEQISSENASMAKSLLVLEGLETNLPKIPPDVIEALRSEILSCYEGVSLGTTSDVAVKLQGFKKLAEKIARFRDEWSGEAKRLPQERQDEFSYLLNMELASAYSWVGRLMLAQGSTNSIDEEVETGETAGKYLYRAQKLLFDVAALGSFTNDPVLLFRLGQTYRDQSNSDMALGHFEAAYENMRNSDWRDAKSVFEILIPRHLGYMYWNNASNLLSKMPESLGDEYDATTEWVRQSQIVRNSLQSALLKAYKVTANIDLREITKFGDPTIRNIDMDRQVSYCNTLYYGIEYLRFGGEKDNLKSDANGEVFDEDYYRRSFDYFDPENPSSVRIEFLDTLIRASIHFKDYRSLEIWVNELKLRIDGDHQLPETYLKHFNVTLRYAQATIKSLD